MAAKPPAELRQKLLVGALVLIAAGYLLDMAYRRGYEKPLADAERRRDQLDKTLRKEKLQVRQQQARLPDLDVLQARSLPRNLEVGVSAYRNWLLRMMSECGLKQANLDSGSPAAFRQIYRRVDFSVRAQGTLEQVTQFLHRFYGTDYLHKIRSLSISPLSDGSVDMAVAIEALSLNSATSETELADLDGKRSLRPLEEYQVIARRNVFRGGDPLAARVALSAITRDAREKRQAWLTFPGRGRTRIVNEGDTLALEGSQVQILKIEAEMMEIELDGERREVRIGQTLR